MTGLRAKPILALSTCWNSHRHHEGDAMLREVADLGFEFVELSHGVRISLVPGILRAVADGVIRVSSTHNFCPLPTGVMRAAPNYYEPSALATAEREQWSRHTRRSIDFAAQVGASCVICHLGSVRFAWLNPARRVDRYLQTNPQAGRSPEDAKYRRLLEKSLARLHSRLPPYWSQVKSSVRDILEYAAAKKVRLGFENRERFEELPLDAAWKEFLAEFSPEAPVGYWHDTGHAEIKEAMGMLDHRRQLEEMADRTLGFHLHDVDATGRDHRPLGAGRIDFAMVSRYWRPAHVLTLELNPRVSTAEVQAAKARVESLLSGRVEG